MSDLKKQIELQLKTATGTTAGHLQLALERMKNPKDAKPTLSKTFATGGTNLDVSNFQN